MTLWQFLVPFAIVCAIFANGANITAYKYECSIGFSGDVTIFTIVASIFKCWAIKGMDHMA